MKRKNTAAHTDYTPQMLPQNRKAIFFDVLQLQWRKLLLLGGILVLFSLPLLLSAVFGSIYSANFIAAAEASGLDPVLTAGGLRRFDLLHSAVNIGLFLIFLIGLAGVLRILRQFAWEENVHMPTEFAAGIKNDYGQLALLGGLGGAVAFLCKWVLYFSTGYRSGITAAVSLIPLATSVFLLLPAACLCLAMIPVYANSLRADLKNAFYVYFSAPLRVLGTLLVCAVVWVPCLLPRLFWQVIGHLFGFLTLPVILLAWLLFCFARFDVSINAENCPELVGKGIFVPQSGTPPTERS